MCMRGALSTLCSRNQASAHVPHASPGLLVWLCKQHMHKLMAPTIRGDFGIQTAQQAALFGAALFLARKVFLLLFRRSCSSGCPQLF